jgi:4-hydroxythreonine-4-phosphate dehydrogenase
VERVVMMLACPALRVVPATIHIALSEVPSALTEALLEEVIRITHAGLIRDFGIARPPVGGGGAEPACRRRRRDGAGRTDWIAPLVARLAAEGLRSGGRCRRTRCSMPAARKGYDAAICMYHDQALIPIKTIDFAGRGERDAGPALSCGPRPITGPPMTLPGAGLPTRPA